MRTVLGVLLVGSLGLLVFPAVGLPYLLALTLGGALAYRATGRGDTRGWFRRLDDLIHAGEEAIVGAALVVMTVAVFVDVVWRTSHTDPETTAGLGVVVFVLCVAGGLTARWPEATRAKRLLAGLAAFALLAVLGVAIHAAPNGFGWSQRLALVLMLWVGMLGTSMASKRGRHITVDAVRRVVPERFVRGFEIAADVVTLAFATLLCVLAVTYVQGNWDDWIESERRAGIFESIPVPYWAATLPIVIAFGLMAARTLGTIVSGPVKADLLESVGHAPAPGDASERAADPPAVETPDADGSDEAGSSGDGERGSAP